MKSQVNKISSLHTLPSKFLALLLTAALAFYVPVPAYAQDGGEEPSSLAAELASAAPAQIEYESSADFASDQILVTYGDAGMSAPKAEAVAEVVEEGLSDEGLKVAAEISSPTNETGTTVVATVQDDMSVKEALEAAASVDGVARVQPNYRYSLLEDLESVEADEADDADTVEAAGVEADDADTDAVEAARAEADKADAQEPAATTQASVDDPWVVGGTTYYLDNINAFAAWDIAKTNNAVTVAVLDTGCALDHEDLQANVLYDLAKDFGGSYASTGRALRGDVSSNKHGTHVCGLIGATANNGLGIAGVSYNANVLPICVFDSAGYAYSSSIVAGLRYVKTLIDEGQLSSVRVVNMSLGIYYDEGGRQFMDGAMADLIDELRYDYDVAIVCAGGNGDRSTGLAKTTPIYPADYTACFAVMAMDQNKAYARFSDYNESKDIGAPGVGIVSTVKGSTDTPSGTLYGSKSGTSMASPIVSGSMALLLSYSPKVNTGLAMTAMRATATAATGNNHSINGSAGAMDLAATLRYLKNYNYNATPSVSSANISLDQSFYYYSGSECKPGVTVSLAGKKLAEGVDYRIEYRDNVNAGTASVVVTGLGSVAGSTSVNFTIAPMVLYSMDLSYETATYSGGVKRPSVTIWDDFGVAASRLSYSNDLFELTYDPGRKYVGTYQVTVTGKGNYVGTLTREFVIKPMKTYITSRSALTGGFKVKWRKVTKQISGYEVRYSTSSSFSTYSTKRITSYKTYSKTIKGLKRHRTYYVKVRVYKDVNGERYYGSWCTKKSIKTK